MAWAEQLPSGNWRACWRDLSGKTRKTGKDPVTNRPFTRKSHAERVASSKEDDARRGIATADGRAPTWETWLPYWLEGRVVEPQTQRQDRTRINRYLLPKWGKRRLNTITRREVQVWANELCAMNARGRETPISPATAQRVIHLFSASMKAAVLDERVPIAANPCVAIELPPADSGGERFLTREEVDKVAHYMNEPYRSAWLILVGTGARFGELAGMHWDQVDMANRLIDIRRNWDTAAGEVKPYTKGKKRRVVPIPDWLYPTLQRLHEAAPEAVCPLPHRRGTRCRSYPVLLGPRGAALDVHNVGRRAFATAVAHAKIAHCTLHDARHTYASWLIQAGVSIQEVQRLLGHASITTTQRYTHLADSQNDKVLAALNRQSGEAAALDGGEKVLAEVGGKGEVGLDRVLGCGVLGHLDPQCGERGPGDDMRRHAERCGEG